MKSPFVAETSIEIFIAGQPARLIGNKAYDSAPLDAGLAERGIEMVAPNEPEEASEAGR